MSMNHLFQLKKYKVMFLKIHISFNVVTFVPLKIEHPLIVSNNESHSSCKANYKINHYNVVIMKIDITTVDFH